MNHTELPYCSISYKRPLVHIILKEGAELDAKEMKQMFATANRMTRQQQFVVLTDARVNVNATSEARKVAASKSEAPFIIANAVLVNNLAVKLTANFFAKFNKPHFKFRVFNNESKAIKWLQQFEPQVTTKEKKESV
jgi:hypothetical protein